MALYLANTDGERGAKRPEIAITLHADPVVVWAGSSSTLVCGTAEVVSQSAMPACAIRVMLVGTWSARSAVKRMGRSRWTHSEFLREELDVQCSKAAFLTSDHACPAGRYVVPFAFALDPAAPPTLRVPHCRASYAAVAVLYCGASQQLARAQRPVTVASHALSGAPASIAACSQPVSQWGTLGAETCGRGMFPFCVSIDRTAARAGDTVRIRLDIYPPAGGGAAPEVTAYYVSTRLVQRTCRVAPAQHAQAGGPRTLWTQRSLRPAPVAGTVDLTRIAAHRRLRAEWPLRVPRELHDSVHAAGIAVCYEVRVRFVPRAFAGGLLRKAVKHVESWSGAVAPVSSTLPLVVVPGWPPAPGDSPPPYGPAGEL
ncbi:hypothetical protein IWQ56_002078 [Coemansia nantahalensis]|nr:hypothetical protein IWQ56_002078 [Coemansia nantahalensis]